MVVRCCSQGDQHGYTTNTVKDGSNHGYKAGGLIVLEKDILQWITMKGG